MNFSRDDDWDVQKDPRQVSKGQLLFWIGVVVVLAVFLSPSERDEAGEEEARQELLRHPFWGVKMDAQAVNEMADTIVIPKAFARRASSSPIPPRPMIPRTFPFSANGTGCVLQTISWPQC